MIALGLDLGRLGGGARLSTLTPHPAIDASTRGRPNIYCDSSTCKRKAPREAGLEREVCEQPVLNPARSPAALATAAVLYPTNGRPTQIQYKYGSISVPPERHGADGSSIAVEAAISIPALSSALILTRLNEPRVRPSTDWSSRDSGPRSGRPRAPRGPRGSR